MRKSRSAESQFVAGFAEEGSGLPVGKLCREGDSSPATYRQGKRKYSLAAVCELERMRELGAERGSAQQWPEISGAARTAPVIIAH
jgi:hypothetical protein